MPWLTRSSPALHLRAVLNPLASTWSAWLWLDAGIMSSLGRHV